MLCCCRELISVAVENERIGFSMKGYVTNANYSMKKCQCLLFINRKCVFEYNKMAYSLMCECA